MKSVPSKKKPAVSVEDYTFSSSGNTSEFYISVNLKPVEEKKFYFLLKELFKNYFSALKAIGLRPNSAIYIILFTDTSEPDEKIKTRLTLLKLEDLPVSIVRQAPLFGYGISLIAYCLKSPTGIRKKRILYSNDKIKGDCYINMLKHYKYILALNLTDENRFSFNNVLLQTTHLFEHIAKILKQNKGTLVDNLLRTWIYVDNLYFNYKKMCQARTKIFFQEGLSPKTHFVASTGIGGKIGTSIGVTVGINALSIFGLKQNQLSYIRPYRTMSPTYKYNVTFERGTKCEFGDRTHIYISGTASINKQGKVAYAKDITKQTRRTFSNIKAVINTAGGSIRDLAFLIIYVKYIKDAEKVKNFIDGLSLNIPCVFLHAPICRKEWLVEMEGVAIVKKGNRTFLPF